MVFSVAALDFFVLVFLNLSLENSGSGRFVEAGGLEDVRGVDPVIVTASHDMLFLVEAELKLVDRDLPLTVRTLLSYFASQQQCEGEAKREQRSKGSES